MALRDLLNVEMVAVSAALLDASSPTGAALRAELSLAAELAELHAAHTAIAVIALPKSDPVEQQIVELTDLLGVTDQRADEVFQSANMLAQHGATLLPPGPARVCIAAATRAAFTISNADIINAPYDQAPIEAASLRARLTPEVRAALSVIKVDDVTVIDGLDEWIALSEHIGQLEARRAQLVESRAVRPATRAEIVELRARWVRAVQHLFDELDRSHLPAATRDQIVSHARSLERAAAERRGRVG